MLQPLALILKEYAKYFGSADYKRIKIAKAVIGHAWRDAFDLPAVLQNIPVFGGQNAGSHGK